LASGNVALLDTSVYIENFRTGRFTETLIRSPWIVRCSAVVLHELRRGARSKIEARLIDELASKIRIITPTERHWNDSGDVLARMGKKRGYAADKLRSLAFDVLIALSARDTGASLVTCDRDDFADIRKYVLFKVVFW
jgi:predicted nucleic acid-binding protein